MTNRQTKFLELLFLAEGGLNSSTKSVDKGGLTKYGISLKFLKITGLDLNQDGVINENDVKSLTKDQAEAIYLKYFYSPHLENINDAYIAFKLFDLGVNMGAARPTKWIQHIVNTHSSGYPLKLDGVIGPKTVKAINNAKFNLYWAFIDRAEQFYKTIAKKEQKIFLKGWLNRLEKFPNLI